MAPGFLINVDLFKPGPYEGVEMYFGNSFQFVETIASRGKKEKHV